MKFLTLFFSFYFVLTTFAQAQNGPNIQIPLQDNPAFTSKGRPAPFTVAIIDTGVDYNHPQLSHLIKLNPLEPNEIQDNDKNGYVGDRFGFDFIHHDNRPYDFIEQILEVRWKKIKEEDPEFYEFNEDTKYLVPTWIGGHGTHVTGIFVNSSGGQIPFLPLRISNLDELIEAIKYALSKNAKIINLSMGQYDIFLGPAEIIKVNALENLIVKAKDTLFVFAAGNENLDMIKENICLIPACIKAENVLSVGALNDKGNLASFTNIGDGLVDVYAPGVNILSAWPGPLGANNSKMASGTSMSAPYVSGIAAKILLKNPNLLNKKAKFLKKKILEMSKMEIKMFTKSRQNIGAKNPLPLGVCYPVQISTLD